MSAFASLPLDPLRIVLDAGAGTLTPEGPLLTRRMSDMTGAFADTAAWRQAQAAGDPVVYTVASSPVPEENRELPQSITTIYPGDCGGELYMTKGHQHPDAQGEIYLGLSGVGGLLMFDGERSHWIDMAPGVIGYIPPGWAHRSVNVGAEPYRFLAVYPGCAGHDYDWVLRNGMGRRAMRAADGYELVPFGSSS
ncbi:glucose-6-phosphate isomerase [Microtetraspora sp. NBRC 13810]|uniref:glucose-6-phosphate isomerase family protein n=1 Tax=Microtetraspora sp. NBRC 13810 TaxID=3030990 RepID=UPI0024A4789B|nr:glucose-6-phosphate isomerase family protein [Microtetraspora sp. NBRC 13810]GLW07084.1 glucose-6-phosphate isomerase [Microtetraspora sp. NBRC 13810]